MTKNKPMTICNYPNCPETIPLKTTFCQYHTKKDVRANDINKHIYKTRRWTNLSKLVRHQNPLCAICQYSPSRCTDHIIPLENGGDPWDRKNLQALCYPCHARKSSDEKWERYKKKKKERVFHANNLR